MPYWKGEKWACYSCTKGHRSSKCAHYDRILYKVRKPGRPLNSCPHILPDSIPPGTFVNTSSESMANGEPPKEACNCKNDLVQVAIPRVKSCSCLTPESMGATIPPSSPSENVDNPQAGVRNGRINKRFTNRRKKSTILEDVAAAVRVEATKAGTGLDMPRANNIDLIPGTKIPRRTSCSMSGWQTFDLLVGADGEDLPGSPTSQSTERLDSTSNEPKNAFQSPLCIARSFGLQSSPIPQPAALGEMCHLSLSQTDDLVFQAESITTDYDPSFPVHNSKDLPASGLYEKFPGIPYKGHSSMVSVPSVRQQIPKQPDEESNGDVEGHASLGNSTGFKTNGSSDGMLSVELMPSEWVLIQQIRLGGLELDALSKMIRDNFRTENAESFQHQTCNRATIVTDDSPSNVTKDSLLGRNPENDTPSQCNEECCSDITKDPLASTNISTSKDGGCCGSKQQRPQQQLGLNQEFPRCRCGDACRCVPCADHPHNPAMLAYIRENMELIGPQGLFDPLPTLSSPDGTVTYDDMYNEDGDSSPQNIAVGDFSDFIFADYKYGLGCSEGMGGCKCSEGCTCIGCLIHGGHDDSMLIDMSPDIETSSTVDHEDTDILKSVPLAK